MMSSSPPKRLFAPSPAAMGLIKTYVVGFNKNRSPAPAFPPRQQQYSLLVVCLSGRWCGLEDPWLTGEPMYYGLTTSPSTDVCLNHYSPPRTRPMTWTQIWRHWSCSSPSSAVIPGISCSSWFRRPRQGIPSPLLTILLSTLRRSDLRSVKEVGHFMLRSKAGACHFLQWSAASLLGKFTPP